MTINDLIDKLKNHLTSSDLNWLKMQPTAETAILTACDERFDAILALAAPPEAFKVYKTERDAALADYLRIEKAALADYKRIKDAAWADYERIEKAACADYDRIRDAAWADYERIEKPALADYERIEKPAWADYEALRGVARMELIEKI